jgi:hypothetical protein
VSTWKKLIRSKFFVAGLVFIILSSIVSYREIEELISGRDAVAIRAMRYPVESKGWFGKETKLAVNYEFNDADGNHRKGHDEVDATWQPPKNGPIMVRYMPGPDGRSRLADHHDWLGIALFGIGVLFMIVARHQLLRPPKVTVSQQKSRRKNKKKEQ